MLKGIEFSGFFRELLDGCFYRGKNELMYGEDAGRIIDLHPASTM